MEQSFAVLADIHGNVWALEAVLRDINRRRINQIINLGDLLYGPLEPLSTARLLIDSNFITVQGNEDRIIHENVGTQSDNATLAFVLNELSVVEINWLKKLPMIQIIEPDILIFHGTPLEDNRYFLEDISSGVPVLKSDSALTALLDDYPQKLILCGHSHLPNLVRLSNGKLVVNPGSVGLPAYTDDQPVFHKIETGSPHAAYAIISPSGANWQVEFIRLPYDWELAARTAHRNHRDDWARWLRTGRSSG